MTFSTTTPLEPQELKAIRNSTAVPSVATTSWTPLGSPGASTPVAPR